jgi:hypothetical protein
MEMTKKAAAQYSIDAPFRQKYSSQHLGSAAVVWQVSGGYLLIWEARIEFLRAKRRWRCNGSPPPLSAGKVAPLIHRDRTFCSFSRAWRCAGRDERSPPPRFDCPQNPIPA